MNASEDLHQSGFAGTVFADQGDNLAARQLEIHASRVP